MFISLLTSDPDRITMIRELLALEARGGLQVVISTFVMAEVRPYDSSVIPENQAAAVADMFASGRMEVLAVTPSIARRAAKMGFDHPNLAPADCVHIATALEAEVDVLVTYDGSGKRRRPSQMPALDNTLGSPPLRIHTPFVPGGPLLVPPSLIQDRP